MHNFLDQNIGKENVKNKTFWNIWQTSEIFFDIGFYNSLLNPVTYVNDYVTDINNITTNECRKIEVDISEY